MGGESSQIDVSCGNGMSAAPAIMLSWTLTFLHGGVSLTSSKRCHGQAFPGLHSQMMSKGSGDHPGHWTPPGFSPPARRRQRNWSWSLKGAGGSRFPSGGMVSFSIFEFIFTYIYIHTEIIRHCPTSFICVNIPLKFHKVSKYVQLQGKESTKRFCPRMKRCVWPTSKSQDLMTR